MGLLEAIGMKKEKPTAESLACQLCTVEKTIKAYEEEKCYVDTTHNHSGFYGYDRNDLHYRISISTKNSDEIHSLQLVINGWMKKNNAPKIKYERERLADIKAELKKLI